MTHPKVPQEIDVGNILVMVDRVVYAIPVVVSRPAKARLH